MHRPDAEPAPERPSGRLALQGARARGRRSSPARCAGTSATPEARSATASCSSRATANPLVYAMLAVYNEALRARYEQTGDARFLRVQAPRSRALSWRTCSTCATTAACRATPRWRARRSSSSSTPGRRATARRPRVGEAVALKHAGAGDVKVFAIEGEGGHTAGAHHEVKNSAWGLGLDNLVYLFDWNDYGIDPNPCSSVVHGTPAGLVRVVRLARRAARRTASDYEPVTARRARRPRSRRTPTSARGACGSRRARAAATASTTSSRTARRTSATPSSSGSREGVRGEVRRRRSTAFGDSRIRATRRRRAAQAAANLERVLDVLRERRGAARRT